MKFLARLKSGQISLDSIWEIMQDPAQDQCIDKEEKALPPTTQVAGVVSVAQKLREAYFDNRVRVAITKSRCSRFKALLAKNL